jgi:hypothetical protein
MSPLVIAVVVVLVIGVGALVALNPVIARKSQEAVDRCRAELGGREQVRLLESRAVGFATDPEEAGGLRGQGCLGVNATDLLFVTTIGHRTLRIPRASILRVDTSGDPRSEAKATVLVTFSHPEHGEVTASWRLPDPRPWLVELGYDWGPEGPPALTTGGSR